jgi:hypothetical protein
MRKVGESMKKDHMAQLPEVQNRTDKDMGHI